ncbi:MAG: ABC transporter substrate-binding protein [Desulfovermiculus sp.]|nr:ABC transporter substrate-binding protein [Desulfovermiculus sp.]
MKRKGFALGLSLALLIMLNTNAICADELEIGALYPLSGSLSLLGEESWRGAEIARIMRNEDGGVAGKEIVYVKGDASSTNAAKSETERMIDRKKVPAILGTYSSALCKIASEVAARKGVLYFELGAIAEVITERGYETIFRTNPTAVGFSETQVNFITDWYAPHLGKKPEEMRIAFVHEDSDYGSSMAENFAHFAEDAGLNMVTEEAYHANTRDLSSVILRLRRAEPDIVIAVSYANDAILMARQAYELKLGAPIMGTGGGHSLQSFVDALGEEAEGVLNVDFTQYQVNEEFTPGLKKFLSMYKETFNEEPRSGHSLANYMGANVVFDLIEKTGGSLDAKKIRKAAMEMDIPLGQTATGWGVKYNEKGQNTRAEPFVTQWRDGKLVTVWPEGAAVMEPIIRK